MIARLLLLLLLVLFFPALLTAQGADEDSVFLEDRTKTELEREARKREERKREERERTVGTSPPFDISAPLLDFDSATNTFRADGGLVISYGVGIVEAERGNLNAVTGAATLERDVRITDPTAKIVAEQAEFNLKTRTGSLTDAEIYFEEGNYLMTAERAEKLGELSFTLDGATLTTCECPGEGDCLPWKLNAKRAEFTLEGYGTTKSTVLEVLSQPVFYLPYLIFPVKSERQTGLLPATIGNSNKTGFQFQLPFFWAVDESTDMTLIPQIETEARVGIDTELRKVFTEDHTVQIGAVYFDESKRGDDLLGTNVDDLDDKTPDEHRLGAYWEQIWDTEVGDLPIQILIDGGYVSDDLFPREIENERIAPADARYVTSRGVARTTLFDTFAAELATEYSQALTKNSDLFDSDDLVFQRLPKLTVEGIHRFRPFPHSASWLKFVLSDELDSTVFYRKALYRGTRNELQERLTIPFHYRNYFDLEAEVGARGTAYTTEEIETSTQSTDSNATPSTLPDSSSNRLVPSYNLSGATVLERVFSLEEDNLFKRLVDLGVQSRYDELVRVKHTIEPFVNFHLTPDVDQSDNPQFDSEDRLAERRVLTYGVVQSLLGRFERRNAYLYDVEEITPELEDVSPLLASGAIEDLFGLGYGGVGGQAFRALSSAGVLEVATFSLTQSYDLIGEVASDEERFSDIDAELVFRPNEYLNFDWQTDFDADEQEFRSYRLGTSVNNKRGDRVATNLQYVEDEVRQLESGVEFSVRDGVRVGYYGRYNDLTGKFIENRAAVRFYSACKCWVFDLNLTDQVNPNETRFTFTLTLVGLGELTQRFFTFDEENANQ